MGANFVTQHFKGSLTPAELETAFAGVQDQDRYENGHSYSGGFGMATGLICETEYFFNQNDAEEWLSEHCQKWEEARAVKYKRADGEPMWLVGASCSS